MERTRATHCPLLQQIPARPQALSPITCITWTVFVITPDAWRLDIKLTYHGDPAGHTSFNLHGYSQQEAEQVARNIRSNAYIMKEIDEQLWGESD